MPRTPDASAVTTFRRINATVPVAPAKRSASFAVPPTSSELSATTRATQEAQSISRSQSVLGVPSYRSPRFNGRFFVI